jgi:hypothetical protein
LNLFGSFGCRTSNISLESSRVDKSLQVSPHFLTYFIWFMVIMMVIVVPVVVVIVKMVKFIVTRRKLRESQQNWEYFDDFHCFSTGRKLAQKGTEGDESCNRSWRRKRQIRERWEKRSVYFEFMIYFRVKAHLASLRAKSELDGAHVLGISQIPPSISNVRRLISVVDIVDDERSGEACCCVDAETTEAIATGG